MAISPLLERGEIPHMASLVVLADCGGGRGVVASSEEHCATKVDSTGITTINMLLIINTSHLIITK